MRTKTLLACILVCVVALLGSARVATAQHNIKPVVPTIRGPVPSTLVNCTAEALNMSGFVGSDGSVVVYNIPSSQGSVRVQVTCQDQSGATVTGQSGLIAPVPGFSLDVGSLDFGGTTMIPKTLTIFPNSPNRVGVGANLQLSVQANNPDNSTGDVTPGSTGTIYQSTNPNIVTVSADGLVTGVSRGTAVVFALNGGSSGFATINVSPGVKSISVTPPSITFGAQTMFPPAPVQLTVTATLTDLTTIDFTAPGSGVSYTLPPNSNIIQVGSGGLVTNLVLAQTPGGPFTTTINVADSLGTAVFPVNVTVNVFDPIPTAAYATPGYAYNADVDGTLVYVADDVFGLQVMDVSASGNGRIVGSHIFGSGVSAVDVKILTKQLAAVALGTNGFSLVNIVNPTAPTECSRTAAPAGYVQDLWLSGNTLFVGDASGVLAVYDVTPVVNALSSCGTTTKPLPTLKGSRAVPGLAAVTGDAGRGLAVAVTAGPPGIVSVFQMTAAPASSWIAGTVPLPAPFGYNCQDVVLNGTSLYAACGRDGVFLVDTTDPAHPSVQASGETNGNSTDAHNLAYLNTAQGPLIIVGDDFRFNAVPFFTQKLDRFFDVEVCPQVFPVPPPSTCFFPDGNHPIQTDANGVGAALGNGFGVQTVGSSGIQVVATQPVIDNGSSPPDVWISSPTQNAPADTGSVNLVNVNATDDVAVASVSFFVNSAFVASSKQPPYQFPYVASTPGQVVFTATATDNAGNTRASGAVYLQVSTPSVPATRHTLAAGGFLPGVHTCQAFGTGTVSCWGNNSSGQIGNGTTLTPQPRPSGVIGITNAVAVTAGGSHSCALLATGAVSCWGSNSSLQLGDPNTTGPESTTPVPVFGISNAIQVAAGNSHTCALISGGTVQCWGDDTYGQLGVTLPNGDTATPVTVPGIANAVEIGAGIEQTCARLGSGSVMCWGDNSIGELGNGTFTSSVSPVLVQNLTNAAELSVREFHGCARRTTGAVVCWGDNANGENGDGTANSSSAPVNVVGISNAVEISAGVFHGCARLTTGGVVCWGYDGSGELGDGTNPQFNGSPESPTPLSVAALGDALQISAGSEHTCAISASKGALCWGNNADGAVGNGQTNNSILTPVAVAY